MKKILLFVFILIVSARFLSQAQTQEQRKPILLTFEEEQIIKEKTIFPYLDAIRHQGERRASSGRYSGMLTELTVSKTQSTPIQVKKGEQLVLEAYAHYENTRNKKLLKNLAIAVAAGVAASELSKASQQGEQNKQASRTLAYGTGTAIAIPALIKYLKGKPQAMILWERYNNNRQLLEEGHITVDGTARGNWQLMKQFIHVSDDGYVIVHLVNQSKTPVWFDDVQLAKALPAPVPNEDKTTQADNEAKPAKQKYIYSTMARETENMDAGCGDASDSTDTDDECTACNAASTCYDDCWCRSGQQCLPPVECSVCDMTSGCYSYSECNSSSDPCSLNPFSCECNAAYCESGGNDPCSQGMFSCECDPRYCAPPSPCDENPYSCECNPSNCGPSGPCETNPHSCECSVLYCGPKDCAGVSGGYAYKDDCGTCVGGTTGKAPFWYFQDNDNDGWGNSNTAKRCFNNPGSNWVMKSGDINDNCYDISNILTQCLDNKIDMQIVNNQCDGYKRLLDLQRTVRSDSTTEMTAVLLTNGQVIILPWNDNSTYHSHTLAQYKDGQGRVTIGISPNDDNVWEISYNDFRNSSNPDTETYQIAAFIHTHPINGNEDLPSPADKVFAADHSGTDFFIINDNNVVKYGPDGKISTTTNNCK